MACMASGGKRASKIDAATLASFIEAIRNGNLEVLLQEMPALREVVGLIG